MFLKADGLVEVVVIPGYDVNAILLAVVGALVLLDSSSISVASVAPRLRKIFASTCLFASVSLSRVASFLAGVKFLLLFSDSQTTR